MLQPAPNVTSSKPLIKMCGTRLTFTYFGRCETSLCSLQCEVSFCLAKAGVSFGRCRKCLWKVHGIKLHTKMAVYRTVVYLPCHMELKHGLCTVSS